MNKRLVSSYIFTLLCVSFFIAPMLSIAYYTNAPASTSYQHPSIRAKTSGEQDTIDSFNVNPAQRWNVSTSGSGISSSINNGNLQLNNYNNGSSQTSYTANRPLSKTDSKIEYRYYAPDVSGPANTSEYFRDQLGTPMTFDSGVQGWFVWAFGSQTLSQSNGMLKVVTTGSGGAAEYTPSFSTNVYTNISFDLYCSSAITIRVYLRNYIGTTTYGSIYYDISCPTILTSYNIPISSFSVTTSMETVSINDILIRSLTAGTFYLDNIQILGSYNYPTQNLYPNNWGFDSSKEYTWDQTGVNENFESGTTQGFTGSSTTNMLLGSSILFPNSGSYNNGDYINSSVVSSFGSIIKKTGTFSVDVTGSSTTFLVTISLYVSLDGLTWTATGSSASWATTGSETHTLSDATARTTTVNSLKYGIFVNFGVADAFTVTNTVETQATYTTGAFSSTVANQNSKYLAVSNTSSNYLIAQRGSLSISAATYKYGSFAFNSTNAITSIYIFDSAGTIICASSLGWTGSSAWHLFSCTAASGNWTGTESTYTYVFVFASSTSQKVNIDFSYWYDASLGNVEGWSSQTNMYNYVNPEGYLVDHITTSASNTYQSYYTTYAIDSSIYKYFSISIKADGSTGRYFEINKFGGIPLTPKTLLSTSFQTYTFDFSSSADWTGTITLIYIKYYSSAAGANPILNSVFTIDYILLTATPSAAPQQPFQIGFLNPSTFAPLFNLTQVYLNTTAFYWLANVYDSQGNVVAYYQSATQTSVISGYPAVADSLYVNSFDSTTLGWRLVGTTPYLNAVDSSYLSNLLTNLNSINFGTGTLSNASSTTTSLTASLSTPSNSHWYKTGTFSVDVTGSVGYTPATYTGVDSTALLNFSTANLDNTTSLVTYLNASVGTVSWYKSGTFSISVNASSTTPAMYQTNNTLYLDVSTDGGSTWTLGVASALWTNNQSAVKSLSDTISRYTWKNKLAYRLRDVQTGNGSATLNISSTTETQATYKYQVFTTTTNTLYLDVSTNGGNTWALGLDSFSWVTNDTAISHTFSDSASYDITNSFLEYRLRLVQTGNGTDSLSITSTTETQATYTYIPSTATENWFSFADESSTFTSGYTTTLELYISKSTVGDQVQWQIDNNGDGSPDCYGTISSVVVGWNSITPSSTCLDTKTEINNARLSVVSIGVLGEMRIDAAYLSVTHDSTEVSSAGWGGYYRGKISYTLETSALTIEMDTDGGTKLFKVTYPDSFTVTNQQNALFSLDGFPTLYFSVVGQPIAYSRTMLDYINAPFAESYWKIKSSNIDSHWVVSPLSAVISPLTSGGLTYALDIPLLDSFSGTLLAINNNGTLAALSVVTHNFNLSMVNPQTGALEPFFTLILQRNYGDVQFYFIDWVTNNIISMADIVTTTMYDSSLQFNVILSNARTQLTLATTSTLDINNTNNNVYANSFSWNLTALAQTYPSSYAYSQEFVASWLASATLASGSTGGFTYRLDNFQFQTRDWFQDAIISIVNAGGGIFAPLFQGLANALGSVLTVIGRFWAQIQNAVGLSMVSGLVAQLPAAFYIALKPGFDAITNAFGPLTSIMNSVYSAINNVNSAIGNLAGQIATQLGLDKLFDTLNGFIQDIGSFVWSFFIDNSGKVLNAIFDVLASAADTIWNIIEPVVNLAFTFFGNLWATFVYYVQQVATTLFNWILGIFNLLNLFNQLKLVFNTLLALVMIIYLFITIAVWIGPFWAAQDPSDLPGNFFSIWSFDMTMGFSLLGFRIPIPVIVVWLSWTLYLGLFTVLFPANPFK